MTYLSARRLLDPEELRAVRFRIQYLSDHSDQLRAWEMSFISSVEGYVESDGRLSDKQLDTLSKIFENAK